MIQLPIEKPNASLHRTISKLRPRCEHCKKTVRKAEWEWKDSGYRLTIQCCQGEESEIIQWRDIRAGIVDEYRNCNQKMETPHSLVDKWFYKARGLCEEYGPRCGGELSELSFEED